LIVLNYVGCLLLLLLQLFLNNWLIILYWGCFKCENRAGPIDCLCVYDPIIGDILVSRPKLVLVTNLGPQNTSALSIANSHQNRPTNTTDTPLNSFEVVAHKIQTLEQYFSNMQVSTIKKGYSMEDLCPYPFDKGIYMPPF